HREARAGGPWRPPYRGGGHAPERAAPRAGPATRHYAKRQFTWFRHQLGDWPRSAPEAGLDVLMGDLRRAPWALGMKGLLKKRAKERGSAGAARSALFFTVAAAPQWEVVRDFL